MPNLSKEKLKNLFLTTGDGSERELREVQKIALESLADKWDNTRIHVLQAPTSVGKSMLARILQKAIGAHVITPANVLVDQYHNTYPGVNYLKGQAHYKCKSYKFYTCSERKEIFGCNCGDCHYKTAKERALSEPTFFNPMSLYYTLIGQGIKNLPLRIIDEAHSLLSLLSQISTKSFAKERWFYPDNATNETVFANWLINQVSILSKLLDDLKKSRRQNHKKIIEIHKEILHIKFLHEQFVNNTEQFILFEETQMIRGKRKQYLKLAPISVPRSLINQILGVDKVILMSGTLLSQDIKDLIGDEPYTYHEIGSPIPIKQRPIYFTPTGKMNTEISTEEMFLRIKNIIDKHPNLNTLIHVTYSMQERLLPLFNETYPLVHANNDENKAKILDDFITKGGIFLAAACSEGLDFYGDICRLNIIPKLDFLNLGDKIIQKRRSLPEGNIWFNEQTVKLFCQRVGRSTRNEKDWSYTYCLDPMLTKLVLTCKDFPSYVKESIIWNQ